MRNSEMKVRSINAMKDAKLQMERELGIVTKTGVQRITGLCLNTVRRNWHHIDLSDVEHKPACAGMENGDSEHAVSHDTSLEPMNKPSWWRDVDYFISNHGEMGAAMYEGQFEMISRVLFK